MRQELIAAINQQSGAKFPPKSLGRLALSVPNDRHLIWWLQEMTTVSLALVATYAVYSVLAKLGTK
jgi:hypothetical protein